jgi:2-phosphosulfolactate phosphatase
MIDVALTPAELAPCDVAVVIDVLRATSTITQALAAGYSPVLCVDTVEQALELRASGRVLAGERQCLMPPGFDQGNSPLDAARRRGDELVVTTTNGTPAIVAAADCAGEVLLGSMLNLRALTATLLGAVDFANATVQLVCAGSDGAEALEDVYLAGRISAGLPGERTDRARIAEAVADAYVGPGHAVGGGAHAARLRQAGMAGDVAYCSRESILSCVPAVASVLDGVAVVVMRVTPAIAAAPAVAAVR